MTRYHAAGFTTVEVLVTLFVATILIAGGYQAYNLVLKSSQQGRNRAEASNIAYDVLRQKLATTTKPCSVVTATDVTIPSTSKLPAPRSMNYTTTCPFGTASNTSLVTITVQFGTPTEIIQHATYSQ